MAQPYLANTGTFNDDGTGSPLRTAFTGYNNNFSQIYSAGPVGSNINISNNTIQSTNLNGDIRLWTNGTGVVTVATNFMPDVGCVRNMGSPTNRFKTLFVQTVNAQTVGVTGNLQVAGNLQVTGNLTYTNISNLNVANSLITAGSGAISPWAVDGGGLFLDGANASITYSASDNSWISNISTITTGNITAVGGYFIGDGGLLSNVQASASADLLTGNTLSGNVLYSSLTTVGTLANLTVGNWVYANFLMGDGSNISNISANSISGTVGNAAYATLANLALAANTAATASQAINANFAAEALSALTANRADFAANASCAVRSDYADLAAVANAATVAGSANIVTNNAQPYITSVGNLTTLTVVGGANVGGVYTDNYYYANGVPVSWSGGSAYGNANVAAFLAGGNLTTPILTTAGITATGNIVSNTGINSPSVTTTALTAYGNASMANLTVVGTVATGNIKTDGYYYANGVPVTFGGGSTYGNANVTALLSSGNVTSNIITTANVSGNNLSFTNLYVGNTLFTRTLVVGTRTTPVTIQLASNNSFNVLTRSGNVSVYTS